MIETIHWSLSKALSTVRGETRKVRILGNAQIGLFWVLGQYFNRTTSADLFVYGKEGLLIGNRGQVRHTPLPGGDAHCAKYISNHSALSERVPSIALGVGKKKFYAGSVQQACPAIPVMWIESDYIENSDQAMQLVKDLVASIEYLRHAHGVDEITLFWATASTVAVLAAANLTSHVIPKLQYMEWDHKENTYVPLPMPSHS